MAKGVRVSKKIKDGVVYLFIECDWGKTHVISEFDDLIGHKTFKGTKKGMDINVLMDSIKKEYKSFAKQKKGV